VATDQDVWWVHIFRAGAFCAFALPRLPYVVPKREVKEEYTTHAKSRSRDIMIREPTRQATSGGNSSLCRPKPEVNAEVKGEDEEVDASVKIAALLRQQPLIASSDDTEDTSKFNTA
jgi:hypothetical protein